MLPDGYGRRDSMLVLAAMTRIGSVSTTEGASGRVGTDEVMDALELDALLFPGSSGASIAARPGYPTVIVPFGFLESTGGPPFPDGFEAKPRPFGMSFTGKACSEPRLIELAYAFEQATLRRVAPPGMP